jgi:glycosyltransferase involved in cell wall biosynthesis
MVEVIDKYKTGLYLSSDNPREIKETLQTLIDDDDLRSTMRENCLKAALVLNWEKEMENLFPSIENT